MPDEIKRIANGLPYRDFVTIGLLLNGMSIKNRTHLKSINNMIPDCWIYVQDTGIKMGRIQIFNNWSPYMVANPQESIWVGLEYFCQENDGFWNLSDQELKDFGCKELIKMGMISGPDRILDYHCEKVPKAYPAYFDTYEEIDKLISWINGYDNLFCVGRNGQHRYNNMDHSMATSFAAVRAILYGQNKDEVWNVNTEKSYHETN